MRSFLTPLIILSLLSSTPSAQASKHRTDKGNFANHERKAKGRYANLVNDDPNPRYRPKSRFAKQSSGNCRGFGRLMTVLVVTSVLIECANATQTKPSQNQRKRGVSHGVKQRELKGNSGVVVYKNSTLTEPTCTMTACGPSVLCQIQTGWEIIRACITSTSKGETYWPCREKHRSEIPAFSDTEIYGQLYSNMEIVGGGGNNVVCKGRTLAPRGDVPKGTEIALRVHPNDDVTSLRAFQAFTSLHSLQRYEAYPVTELYTPVYGIYSAPTKPEFPWKKIPRVSIVEMEYVQPLPFIYSRVHLPDAMVFEIIFGEWAAKTLGNILIDELKFRHLGYNNVDYLRAYEVEDRVFLMREPESPRRLDYDHFWTYYPTCPGNSLHAASHFFYASDYLSPSLDKAVRANVNRNFIEFIFDYFSNYTISREQLRWLKATRKVKHFKMPEQFIPQKNRKLLEV